MVLAYCTTYYHLFNIIQLKLTKLSNENVDLLLSSDVDFTTLEKPLKKSGLFNNVILSPIKNVFWCKEFNEIKSFERSSYFFSKVKSGHGLAIDEYYEHLYIGLDDAYNKFLYYCLSKNTDNVAVHFYDEGTASYVTSISERLKKDGIPHDHFGRKNFNLAIKEILLYAPEIRIVKDVYPVNPIPKIDRHNMDIKTIFNSIFSYHEFTEKKYIYFESASFQDFMPTMDIDVLDMVANIVGKENIVIKLHPRTKNDRFTRRGYSVMPSENLPWEIYAMNESVEDKVFLSNASTAALTSKIIFDVSIHTINLFKMDLLEKTLYTRQKDFPEVYKMQETLFNHDKLCFFAPEDENGLTRIIKYIERNKQ